MLIGSILNSGFQGGRQGRSGKRAGAGSSNGRVVTCLKLWVLKDENLKQLHAYNLDSASPIYNEPRGKVKILSATNVTAERNIRLISDFIMNYNKKDKFQVGKKNRKDFSKNMTKNAFKYCAFCAKINFFKQ